MPIEVVATTAAVVLVIALCVIWWPYFFPHSRPGRRLDNPLSDTPENASDAAVRRAFAESDRRSRERRGLEA